MLHYGAIIIFIIIFIIMLTYHYITVFNTPPLLHAIGRSRLMSLLPYCHYHGCYCWLHYAGYFRRRLLRRVNIFSHIICYYIGDGLLSAAYIYEATYCFITPTLAAMVIIIGWLPLTSLHYYYAIYATTLAAGLFVVVLPHASPLACWLLYNIVLLLEHTRAITILLSLLLLLAATLCYAITLPFFATLHLLRHVIVTHTVIFCFSLRQYTFIYTLVIYHMFTFHHIVINCHCFMFHIYINIFTPYAIIAIISH